MRLRASIVSLAILLSSLGGSSVLRAQALSETGLAQQALEQDLREAENQIAGFEQQLTKLKGQKNSLANKIAQLGLEQKKAAAQIRETNLNIQRISKQVAQTTKDISGNVAHADLLKEGIESMLLNIQKQDNRTIVDILLSGRGLADVANDVMASVDLSRNLGDMVDDLRRTNTELNIHKDVLTQQQIDQQSLMTIQKLQNERLGGMVTEQKDLLAVTKGKESNYQAMLGETQKRVKEIRGRIYELFGSGGQVSFGQAVTIAQFVSSMTGVRASFLLAVLTQESNLGKNVGTCNRIGDPVSKSWRTIMKPERDQGPFEQITKNLGLDTNTTPVSCPMRNARTGAQIGWGGAMGPAQFIPSTWMGYKDKVAAITGKMANPWDMRDAFIASGLKLKAGGAGTKEGEWAAAMRYFSGSTNVRFRFYGDSVVAQAEKYQIDIDALAQ